MAIAIVRTIAELEQLAPASNDAVLVQCYIKVGDGGGGMFLWNGDSTDASDRGTVIIPSTNPVAGRWERMVSEHLNVRWFGAQGDWNESTQTGSDDCSWDMPRTYSQHFARRELACCDGKQQSNKVGHIRPADTSPHFAECRILSARSGNPIIDRVVVFPIHAALYDFPEHT